MFIPFRNELDECFRGDRSLALKLGGCAAVAAFLTVAAMARMDRRGAPGAPLNAMAFVVAAAVAAGVGAALGLALSLKDVVERRLAAGRRVHPVLRLYLGSRTRSAALWFVTILVVGVIGALVTALL